VNGAMIEGCAFQPRCDRAMPSCGSGVPALAAIDAAQRARCINPIAW
jgi:hypothetical protein